MRFVLHWGCLLILALFTPIALPAGGATGGQTEVISSKSTKICFAGDSCEIFPSPSFSSSSLRSITLGTPLTILRIWNCDNGDRWLQVQLQTSDFMLLPSSTVRRGWINV